MHTLATVRIWVHLINWRRHYTPPDVVFVNCLSWIFIAPKKAFERERENRVWCDCDCDQCISILWARQKRLLGKLHTREVPREEFTLIFEYLVLSFSRFLYFSILHPPFYVVRNENCFIECYGYNYRNKNSYRNLLQKLYKFLRLRAI